MSFGKVSNNTWRDSSDGRAVPVKKIQVVMSSNPGLYTINPGQEFNYHAETRLSDTLQLYG